MASTGTGVVIGSHSTKVVQARKKGGLLRLTRVANVRLDAAAAERPLDRKIDQLASNLSSAGLKSGEAMLGITGRDLIIRYTHVPPVPDWRLGMLMKFEIEEVSEQSGGEVSADWAGLNLPATASAEKTVLVALAKNAALAPRIEILGKADLKLRGACPNAIAAYYAYVTTAALQPGEVTLIMHIGAENTDIAIQQDAKLLFARNVAGGGVLFTEAIMTQFGAPFDRAEKMKFQKVDVSPRGSAKHADSLGEKVSNAVLGVSGQFVSMVHSSVMFAKAQTKLKDLDVDKVVLCGGGANLKGFRAYMENNLGMPVELFDPSGAVDLSGLPPEQAAEFEKDATGLTVPLGLASLALDRPDFTVEILPEEYRKRRNFMEKGVWMLGAAAVVAALIIVLFYVSGRDHGAADEHLDAQKGVSEDIRRRNDAYEQEQRRSKLANAKWAAVRREVQTGPCLRKALEWTKNVILDGDAEFKEVQITRVKTITKDVNRPRQNWDAEEEWEGSDERTQRTVRAVTVEFEAEISDIASRPEQVFSRFGIRMGDKLSEVGSGLLRAELEGTAEELGFSEDDVTEMKRAVGGERIEEEDLARKVRKAVENLPTVWLDGPHPGRTPRSFRFSLVFAYLDS